MPRSPVTKRSPAKKGVKRTVPTPRAGARKVSAKKVPAKQTAAKKADTRAKTPTKPGAAKKTTTTRSGATTTARRATAKASRRTKSDALVTYRTKRDPGKTPEPMGRTSRRHARTTENRFVIQEHHACSLHWDLRLERGGVLVSWALPKGLPESPDKNHLAVHTEDHPLEYATFEGEIPRGEYGGGLMTIWDRGTYDVEKWSDREVKFTLHGTKAEAGFVLFQTKDRNWMIHRHGPSTRNDPLPTSLSPMLATAGRSPPTAATGPSRSSGTAYGPFSSSRAVAYDAQSRNDLDVSVSFPNWLTWASSSG